MKERDLQRKILERLKSKGGFWINFHGGDLYMPKGIPDIIGCFEGRFFAFEVKTETGRLSPIQEATLQKLRNAGAVAEVVRSVKDAEEKVFPHDNEKEKLK